MKCIYASVTKSGRYKCTYQNEGEDKKLSSPSVDKMCPFQHYCRKKYEWEHLNQNRCRNYKMEVNSNE